MKNVVELILRPRISEILFRKQRYNKKVKFKIKKNNTWMTKKNI